MSVQVENLEKNMAKLTIEVSAEELEKALQGAYLKQKKNISIPGFRKGKVPRAMIEKMYGAGVFYEDAANALIPQAYSRLPKRASWILCLSRRSMWSRSRRENPSFLLPRWL